MDIRLPGIDGLEATWRIMSQNPIPIVLITASVESIHWNSMTMEALRAGALTVLEKPVSPTHRDYEMLAASLCTQLVIMSQVVLVRQHLREPPAEAGRVRPPSAPRRHGAYKMLGIACSTGGPGSLVQVLRALGPAFPLPILLVQHMTGSFMEGFAAWLGGVSPFSVVVVKDGCRPAPHAVHLAPSERHLRLAGGRLRLSAEDPVSFQCPSGTVLFQSMARELGAGVLGVVLTGMGDDGASGLLDIRHAGGYTIAEDESTAVVYGMPRAAVRLGAVCESLPLPAIGPRILGITISKSKEEVA
jgi:two-component system chemotaxis response regulator CheB